MCASVEGVEDPDWPAPVLNAELAHSAVSRSSYVRRVWKRQVWAVLHQQLGSGGHRVLLALGEVAPPLPELIGVFDFPGHDLSIFLHGIDTMVMTGCLYLR